MQIKRLSQLSRLRLSWDNYVYRKYILTMCVDSYLRIMARNCSLTLYDKNTAVSVSVSVFGMGSIQRKKEESLKLVGVPDFFLELLARFELATSSLPRMRSTD